MSDRDGRARAPPRRPAAGRRRARSDSVAPPARRWPSTPTATFPTIARSSTAPASSRATCARWPTCGTSRSRRATSCARPAPMASGAASTSVPATRRGPAARAASRGRSSALTAENRLRRAVEFRSMRWAGVRPRDVVASLGPLRDVPRSPLRQLGLYRTQQVSPLLPVDQQIQRLREIQPSVFWVYPIGAARAAGGERHAPVGHPAAHADHVGRAVRRPAAPPRGRAGPLRDAELLRLGRDRSHRLAVRGRGGAPCQRRLRHPRARGRPRGVGRRQVGGGDQPQLPRHAVPSLPAGRSLRGDRRAVPLWGAVSTDQAAGRP